MSQLAQVQLAQGSSDIESSRAPDHKVRYGRVEVAVWKKQAEDQTWYSFSVTRSYKDKSDQWQRSASLDEEDALPAAKALEEAYTWTQTRRHAARDQALK